jgi:hypothetical protein
MTEQTTILLASTIFIWLVVLHTFEEIAVGIFDLQLGHIKMEKKRYLLAASGISTLNMITLVFADPWVASGSLHRAVHDSHLWRFARPRPFYRLFPRGMQSLQTGHRFLLRHPAGPHCGSQTEYVSKRNSRPAIKSSRSRPGTSPAITASTSSANSTNQSRPMMT